MFSKEVNEAINSALSSAKHKQCYVTLEYLLISLLELDDVIEVLHSCNVDDKLMRVDLQAYLDDEHSMANLDMEVMPPSSFERAIYNALHKGNRDKDRYVQGKDLLITLLQEDNEYISYLFDKQNVPSIKVIKYISSGEFDENIEMYEDVSVDNNEDEEGKQKNRLPFLLDINERCFNKKTDPLIGRKEELSRMMQTLCRRRKNNVILTGEPGVGKTAMVEGLAQLILDEKVPEPLKNIRLFELNLGILLAGTRYRGDFEERLKSLMQLIKDNSNYILFIDEIHVLIGAGATQGGAMDAANIVKPALNNGELRVIGATTIDEYRGIFEKDKALSRRFQKLNIKEPSTAHALEIVKGLKSKLEKFHDVKYSRSALESAVKMSDKYINDRYLPDKAIDVLDEAGAKCRLQTKKKKLLGQRDINDVIADLSNLPIVEASKRDVDRLRSLEDNMQRVIYGQDEAISVLVKTFLRHKANLSDDFKPLGSFLMVGPTGVGKTELSIQLAKMLGINYLRFDMSEYMERHSVSRLIGSPPGYIGYDNGGLLTEKVSKHPHCVLLLDEIEKAHPDVINILLQVMDYGKLTDASGREVNFRHVIILLTSNVGASNYDKNPLGFVEMSLDSDISVAVKKHFTAEFRNRLNNIVQFNPLSQELMYKIVDKFIFQLEEKLKTNGFHVKLDKKVKEYLSKNGFSATLGARPLKRLIEEKVHQPLSEKLLFENNEKGTVFNIFMAESGDEVKITVSSPELVPA